MIYNSVSISRMHINARGIYITPTLSFTTSSIQYAHVHKIKITIILQPYVKHNVETLVPNFVVI